MTFSICTRACLSARRNFLTRRAADRAYGSGFTPTPFAAGQVELRAFVSGKIAWGLSYRAGVDWLSARTAPYVIGFRQTALYASSPRAVLAPTDRFRAMLTLAYEFGT